MDIRASFFNSLSAFLKFHPLCRLSNDVLSVVGDLSPKILDSNLSVLTAVSFLTALNEFLPGFINKGSGSGDGRRDGVVEVFKDLLPDGSDFLPHYLFNVLTALGTFVTSFEELTELFLGLSKSSSVDHFSMFADEGLGSSIVPGGDLVLDFVEVIESEFLSREGLAHVTFSGRNLSLGSVHLDGGGVADKGSGDKLESSHI